MNEREKRIRELCPRVVSSREVVTMHGYVVIPPGYHCPGRNIRKLREEFGMSPPAAFEYLRALDEERAAGTVE